MRVEALDESPSTAIAAPTTGGPPVASRDPSVDALRGLAIVLVVLGHSILDTGAVLNGAPPMVNMGPFWVPLSTALSVPLNLLYAFHMPLFAFISGLVLWQPSKSSLGVQIKGRVRGLLVPYLAWFLVLYAIDWTPHPPGGVSSALLGALLGRDGLWYLYALFVCTVVVLCLVHTRAARWMLPASALAAIAWATGRMIAVPDLFYFSSVLWIYPFVVLGYLAAPFRARMLAQRWRVVVVSMAVFVPLFYLRYPEQVPRLETINRLSMTARAAWVPGSGLLFQCAVALLPYLCGLAAIAAICALYLSRAGWLIGAQAWLGRKSLGIYATQGVVAWWFASHGMKNAVVLTVVTLGICAIVTVMLERTPVVSYVLLGRRTQAVSRDTSRSESLLGTQ